MRIIAGRHRGRRLSAPPGHALRPTSDRARQALFDVLVHGHSAPALEGAKVLDAFAGTGAFGLEALSRGAAHATFMDVDGTALECLLANVRDLGEFERATVLRADVLSPPRATRPCRLAFLDPPYGSGLAAQALTALAQSGWLAAGTLAIVELAAKEPFEPPTGFAPEDERRYGATRFVLLRRRGRAPARG